MPVERARVISLLKNTYPFYKMGEPLLAFTADRFKTASYEAGKQIYYEEDRADDDLLCLVVSGKVQLTRKDGYETCEVATLGEGDLFGLEMLMNFHDHLTSATALTPVTLLMLDRQAIRALIQKEPALKLALSILLQSYILRLQIPLDWLADGEVVVFMAHAHPFRMWLKLAPAVLFGIASLGLLIYFLLAGAVSGGLFGFLAVIDLVILGAYSVWNYIEWKNDFVVITNQRALYQERVVLLYDSRQEAPLGAILSITTVTNQIGRWLSFGSVVVRTQAGQIILPSVRHPQQVALILELVWTQAKSERTRMERKSFEETIRARLKGPSGAGSVSGKPAGAVPVPRERWQRRLRKWLAGKLDVQIIQGGSITYRQHWIFLFLKLFLPSLVLTGIWGGFLAYLFKLISFLPLAPAILVTLAGTLGAGGWWLYHYIDWRDDYYVITQEQILDVHKKPLGLEEKRSAALKNVQSVDFERKGLLGLFLNFGDVNIMVGEARLTFDNVYNPAEVQRELFKRLAERDYKEKVTAGEAERQRFADWIAAYHKVAEEERARKTFPGG